MTTWKITANKALNADLYLIDGNNHVRRAFHAYSDEISYNGEPTNAIFGFAKFLHRMRAEYGMRRGVVCWDVPGKTHRHAMYEGYKASRSKMPELLSQQWPHVQAIAEAYGLVNAELQGYEADDLLGTLAKAAAKRGEKVCIVTSDKDAWQLIDDKICVLSSGNKGSMITMTKDSVEERLQGVSPMQITDFVGLKGDASDEIPGVPGIGEKTAAQLIRDFGSLEAVLVRIDEVPGPGRRKKLEENTAQARLSKKLAEIDCSVQIDVDVDSGNFDPDALTDVLNRYGLKSLAAQVVTITDKPEATPEEMGRLF